MSFSVNSAWLSGFLLALARSTPWVFITPPFSTKGIPLQVKTGFAAALALAGASHVAGAGLPVGDGAYVVALFTQLMVGFALGLTALLLISAIQAAGTLIDHFAGFNFAQFYDPLTEVQSSPMSRLYNILAITLLFAVNGHLVLVRGFLTSYAAVPLQGMRFGNVAQLLTHDLGFFLVAAIEVAAPVLAVLFLAEVAMGLLARAAPKLNVFMEGFPVRILIAVTLVGLSVPLIGPALGNLVAKAVTGG
jgi:flagellar biosynthetic protein FliR